jgi:O-antigen ligase
MAVVAVGLVRFAPQFQQRYSLARVWIATRNWDTVTSGRVLPYLAAGYMFRDHPIMGVGPGCFKWEYFPYKVKINALYSKLVVGWGINFGEVHNDHLQVLAETGLPGYAIFIAAAVLLGAASLRPVHNPAPSAEARFSRLASLPLVAGFLIAALGQFPLELAATNTVNLFLFALCCAWRPDGSVHD